MNLCAAFRATVATYPDAVALRTHDGARQYTWWQYAEKAEAVARGLAKWGVKRGDTVALLVANHPEMFIADVGIQMLGATPVSVYATLSPEQLQQVFANADCRYAIVDDSLRTTAVDDIAGVTDIFDSHLVELTSAGIPFEARDPSPDDIATIIYTSGTTGEPKGVELTHAQILAQAASLKARLHFTQADRTISFLPSAHIADRAACLYAGIVNGCMVATVRDRGDIAAALTTIRPTYFAAVPRLWEKLKAAVETRMAHIKDPAVIRAALGIDQARLLITAAAPIDIGVLEFYEKLGAPLCDIWGMSEVAGAGTINPREKLKYGSVGVGIPGAELRVAHDNELLIRGPFVMKGYRKRPDLTAEAIDEDGWLHTGDVATIDAEGYVTIVDRKKELIINSAGKNMSPAHIENTIKAQSLLIGNVVCVGDRRPFNVALIALDGEMALAWAASNGVSKPSAETVAAHPQIRAAIDQAVAKGNERLSRVEQIKRYAIVPAFWLPGGDELTPTSKLKRKAVNTKYDSAIEELFASP